MASREVDTTCNSLDGRDESSILADPAGVKCLILENSPSVLLRSRVCAVL